MQRAMWALLSQQRELHSSEEQRLRDRTGGAETHLRPVLHEAPVEGQCRVRHETVSVSQMQDPVPSEQSGWSRPCAARFCIRGTRRCSVGRVRNVLGKDAQRAEAVREAQRSAFPRIQPVAMMSCASVGETQLMREDPGKMLWADSPTVECTTDGIDGYCSWSLAHRQLHSTRPFERKRKRKRK